MAEVPNPAAEPRAATGGASPASAPNAGGEPMSKAARGAVRVADSLPDWLGSIRFRLTALYSLLLFGLAAFMVAGLYGVLASRLHEENVYRTYQVTTVQPDPNGGFQLTPTDIRASYRSVEALANERALSLLRGYSLSALGMLFFASLGIGWVVAGRVLAPIGRITDVAREIQATDLSRRISLRGPPDELRELAETFDAMLARLDEAFAGQQRFIQEASHELRNPLAVMRTNLDVVLGDPDASEAELRRIATLVNASAARMSRLVDDLMVYARLGAPAHDVAPVQLAALAADAADDFAAAASARAIALHARADADPTVVGDRLALRQAVANLLANAVRLAPEHSTITVATGADSQRAWVEVIDQGPGLTPEDRERVFDRFWRGNKQAAREDGRSGLGLAIVAQIMRDHRGTATVEPAPPSGSVFRLSLPLATAPDPAGETDTGSSPGRHIDPPVVAAPEGSGSQASPS